MSMGMGDLNFDDIMEKAKEQTRDEMVDERLDAESLVRQAAKGGNSNTTKQADNPEGELEEEAKDTAADTSAKENDDVEPEVDENPGITYQRRVTHTDTKAQTVGRKANKNSPTCEIRGFPKSLVQMAKASLGGGAVVSNTKALAAFVYATRDTTFDDIDYSDIPDDVIELAKTFDKYKMASAMDRNMRLMLSMMKRMNFLLDDVSLASAFIIYDRLGMNTQGRIDDPADIDFENEALQRLLKNLEDTDERLRTRQRIEDGRPIK